MKIFAFCYLQLHSSKGFKDLEFWTKDMLCSQFETTTFDVLTFDCLHSILDYFFHIIKEFKMKQNLGGY